MGILKSLLVFCLFSSASFAATSKVCEYGTDWSGELVLRFEAHEPKEARGWAPTELVWCKDSSGLYSILTHKAIGLGSLSNLPLRVMVSDAQLKKGEKVTLVVHETSSYDERKAFKLFDSAEVDSVVVFTGTKKQALVIRKELNQVVSNTLFLSEEGANQ
jgi:hypothetical protein